MPLRKSGTWTKGAMGALAALALSPAAASAAACVEAPTTKAFSQYGDTADYSVAPDGTFEAGAKGWTLTSGAKVVSGNTSVKVSGVAGSKSLALPMGGVAISPEFCVGREHPYFRYMLKSNFPGSSVSTIIQYKDANGGTSLNVWLGALSWFQPSILTGTWKAGAKNPLSLTIPLTATGTATARIVFVGTAGSYSIDDVMIDPYRRG